MMMIFTIWNADLNSLIQKTGRCKNNPEKSSVTTFRQTFSYGVFNLYNTDIWSLQYNMGIWRLHEKVFWIFKRACNEDN